MANNFAAMDFTQQGGDSYSGGGRNSPSQYASRPGQGVSGGSSVDDFDHPAHSRLQQMPTAQGGGAQAAGGRAGAAVDDFGGFSGDDDDFSNDDLNHDGRANAAPPAAVDSSSMFDADAGDGTAPPDAGTRRMVTDPMHFQQPPPPQQQQQQQQQMQYDAQHHQQQSPPPLFTGSGSSSAHKRSVDSNMHTASAAHAADAAAAQSRMSLGAASSGSVSPKQGVTGGSSTGTDTVNHLRLWEKQHEAELQAERDLESKARSTLRMQAASELGAWKDKRAADIRTSVEDLRAAEKSAMQDTADLAKTGTAHGSDLQGPALWSAVWDIVDAVSPSSATQQQQAGAVPAGAAVGAGDDLSYMKSLLASLKGSDGKENSSRQELAII